MSSKNIEMKNINPVVATAATTATTQSNIYHNVDVKEETNPKIRYLMQYYGY